MLSGYSIDLSIGWPHMPQIPPHCSQSAFLLILPSLVSAISAVLLAEYASNVALFLLRHSLVRSLAWRICSAVNFGRIPRALRALEFELTRSLLSRCHADALATCLSRCSLLLRYLSLRFSFCSALCSSYHLSWYVFWSNTCNHRLSPNNIIPRIIIALKGCFVQCLILCALERCCRNAFAFCALLSFVAVAPSLPVF